ncbi:MAG TPA: aldose 1-epimerase family protein [Acetobacteraceae bacterium]|jgi:galactose mutarotase-like enzyme|nr:aldose 1-epimerase family protein [Acetobacteraceae bacterium]
MDRYTLTRDGLTVEVKADGAELCSLQDADGHEYIWQALPVWPRHAPVLFPIVGRLKDDTLRHAGRTYRLTQHGFARDRRFALAGRSDGSCRLLLIDDDATRAIYPFAFRFEVAYAIESGGLTATFTINNPADTVLPASMGAHPAFRWPLLDGIPKDAHALTFEHDEPGPLRGVSDGLLTPANRPSPIVNGILALRPELFTADALILEHPASRWVRFGAPGAPALRVSWKGFRELGIWMRLGGDFLCIEPWLGMASPTDFDGDIMDKPGIVQIPPGGSVTATLHIATERTHP